MEFVAAANVETDGGLLRHFHLGNQVVQRVLDPRLVPPNLKRGEFQFSLLRPIFSAGMKARAGLLCLLHLDKCWSRALVPTNVTV